MPAAFSTLATASVFRAPEPLIEDIANASGILGENRGRVHPKTGKHLRTQDTTWTGQKLHTTFEVEPLQDTILNGEHDVLDHLGSCILILFCVKL